MINRSPIHWFGVKYKVADEVWKRLNPKSRLVIDPFAGSLSLFMRRPIDGDEPFYEIVNDLNGFCVNFWRSVQSEGDKVKRILKTPVMEIDLTARHYWLKRRAAELDLQARMMGDPTFFDPEIAGWWAWGHNAWIGSNWCDANVGGPWTVVDGKMVRGKGGISVIRKMPHNMSRGRGSNSMTDAEIDDLISALQKRMRHMIITCGDWKRVLTESMMEYGDEISIFLDPPYAHEGRYDKLYNFDHPSLAREVREWAIRHGEKPWIKIAYCGFSDRESDFPDNWERLYWKAAGGYSAFRKHGKNENRRRECIFFSPHCIREATLFDISE